MQIAKFAHVMFGSEYENLVNVSIVENIFRTFCIDATCVLSVDVRDAAFIASTNVTKEVTRQALD